MTFIEALVGHALFFGVFSVILALRSTRARIAAGRKELDYPIALKCLASVGFGILVVGTSHGIVTSHGFERIFVVATLGSMNVLMFFGLVELFITRIAYDTNCIYQSSIFCRTNSIQFDDVIEVSYSERWNQHIIRDLRGGVVRISKFMNGAEDLLETTIKRMPKWPRHDNPS